MRDRAALALACGLTFAAAMPAGQTSAAPFAVGVLRRDGIVVPFAQHDGKRWRAIWREPNEQVDVPIDVRNVPSRWWGKPGPLDTWQAWPRAEPARTVRVRQPDWFPAHCRRQIGLRTDYRSIQPPAEPGTQPFPKDGLAVAPPQPVERIDIVQPGEPPPQVIDAFNEAEDAAIRDLRGHAARLPASRRHRQGGVAQNVSRGAAKDQTGQAAMCIGPHHQQISAHDAGFGQ